MNDYLPKLAFGDETRERVLFIGLQLGYTKNMEVGIDLYLGGRTI